MPWFSSRCSAAPGRPPRRAWLRLLLIACCATPVLLSSVGCQNRSRPGVSEPWGRYEHFASASPEQTWDAVEWTMQDLGYTVTQRERFADRPWRLEARDAGSNRIKVTVAGTDAGTSRYTVQVDPGRNDAMSRLILESIRQRVSAN